jgi:hypothetical protein
VNLTPFRTALIAGGCAVALSFAALPAHASTTTAVENGPTSTSASVETTPAPADDVTPAPTATPTEAAKPAEKGHPKQVFADTTIEPRVITKHGVHVVYTGLTAHARYQPFYSTGESGGPLGHVRKADAKGRLVVNYHFTKQEKALVALGATYSFGLTGVDTQLQLTKTIEVKYDSDLVWHAPVRHGKTVTLSASVDKAGATGKDKAWKKVVVLFQKQDGADWVTVEKDRTDAKGLAKVTVKSGTAVWRAVVDSTRTVSGSTSKGHKK